MTPAWRDTSFGRLVSHFFGRFFEADLGVSEDAQLGAGPILALLTIPGALMSFVLFGKYSSLMRWFQRNTTFDPWAASIPDKYTFLAFSITVTGIVAVLRWDSLFPDRRDFVNLAPLPLKLRTILFAKVLALAGFLLIFLIDINLVSSIVFPSVVMESEGNLAGLLRFMGAHAVSVAAAGAFMFFAMLALSGGLMALLPYNLYRRLKRYVQFLCVTLLLLLFFSSALITPELERIRTGGTSWVEWLPTVWFLGLYQELHGQAVGRFDQLTPFALKALVFAGAAAALGYALSYRLFFLRSAETVEVISGHFRAPNWFFTAFDRTLLRSGFDRACFRFIVRTLGRSDKHSVILAGALGLGASLAVQAVSSAPRDPGASLSGWLIIAYSLLVGLRFSFGVPSDIRANWIFQFTVADEEADPRRVVRAVMMTAAAPLILFSVPVYASLFGVVGGLVHFAFFTTICGILVQVFTSEFRVIPFTCSWLPGKSNPVLAIASFGVGLIVFGYGLAAFEHWILRSPERFLLFVFLAGGTIIGLWRLRDSAHSVVFQDTRGELDLLRISE
jgi:hypothetical protein